MKVLIENMKSSSDFWPTIGQRSLCDWCWEYARNQGWYFEDQDTDEEEDECECEQQDQLLEDAADVAEDDSALLLLEDVHTTELDKCPEQRWN